MRNLLRAIFKAAIPVALKDFSARFTRKDLILFQHSNVHSVAPVTA
jgi:hypothetical protein